MMDNVHCNGSESRLIDCLHDRTHNCEHHEDVAVNCRKWCTIQARYVLIGTVSFNNVMIFLLCKHKPKAHKLSCCPVICDWICENRPLCANFGTELYYLREALTLPYIVAQTDTRWSIPLPSYARLNTSTRKLECGRNGSFCCRRRFANDFHKLCLFTRTTWFIYKISWYF